MALKKWTRTLATTFALTLIGTATARADGAADGTLLKDRTVQMADKGDFTELLPLPAGKEVTATTDGIVQTDVHLFVYDSASTEVGKDVSPGPQCSVKFTPVKAGIFKFVVKNEGPGANNVTLKVKIAN